jgi:hypothetical protein
MPKRRSDAAFRRFLDQYPKIRMSRFRATGVVDSSRSLASRPLVHWCARNAPSPSKGVGDLSELGFELKALFQKIFPKMLVSALL